MTCLKFPSEEPKDDSEIDTTVCHAADLRADDSDPPAAVVEAQVTSQSSQCDSRGVLGWEAVDVLAAYLVGLNRTITALSSQEEADIVQLYMTVVSSKYS
ncbi:hypothetical protein ROHU_006177 [Labeo rohita]|uniref:Uncharacterized protein n=1 Tax=Labeo rohita TaxID=84645 RepID=A0A498MY20_LABRO|nr:hypothetical protein ROHU_006177 [Labeo rohita]